MTDFTWKEELKSLSDETSKLLYIILKLNKIKQITEEHKKKLKKYVFEENKILQDLLKELLISNDLESFISNIKLIFLDDISPRSKSMLFNALLNALKKPDIEKNQIKNKNLLNEEEKNNKNNSITRNIKHKLKK